MADILRIFPDKQKARSILKMAETTEEMIKSVDAKKFPSNVLKEYYDIIRELISIILLLDGYKIVGEEAHKELLEYAGKMYKDLSEDMILLDDLRVKRNKILYDGFFIDYYYLERNSRHISEILNKLKRMVSDKLVT